MQYLISKELHNEFIARKDYIYDTLKLWTIHRNFNDEFEILESIPFQEIDILFIVAHNNMVKDYLTKHLNKITQKTIVAITCDGNINFSSIKTPGKSLYIAHQSKDNTAEILNGKQYGFSFDLTESEIMFYNNREKSDLNKRLNDSFTKLH